VKVGDLVRNRNNKEIFVVVGKTIRKGKITNTNVFKLADHRGHRAVDEGFLEVICESR